MRTVVVGLAAAVAVTASVLAGSLLVASSAPFDRAFAQQNGPHLAVQFDAGATTAAALEASRTAAGVTAAAGPFPVVPVSPRLDSGPRVPPMTAVGRAEPGGPVDAVALVEGTWVTGPGQVVLSADFRTPDVLDRTLRFPDLPGAPELEVVGVARSISRTADLWVWPDQVAALTPPGTAGGFQVLYRFADAATAEQVDASSAAAVPAQGRTGSRSWLAARRDAVKEVALFVPFLVAFGALGLVMSVLVVGNVVAGAVASGLRRVGVLKALGFTPGQVVRAHVAQALVPAAVGAAFGVVAGNLLAVPVLAETSEVYGTTVSPVAPWVDVAVVAGALGVVAVTAWTSAWRAGRLRAVDALAVGRTPGVRRGLWAARTTARLPLPRAISLGLAHPSTRPARALAMLAAIVFGTTAVTFAIGLGASLTDVQEARDHTTDVVIGTDRPSPTGALPATLDADAVRAAIAAQPGTLAHFSTARREVGIAAFSGSTTLLAFEGDTSPGDYRMIAGEWFDAPGEAVVPSPFLRATGTGIGDAVTLDDRGEPLVVRIVGEVFDLQNDGMRVFTDAATITDPVVTSFDVGLRPGTDVTAYLDGLNAALRPLGVTARAGEEGSSDVLVTIVALTAFLTLLLIAVAGLGVLNGVVLDTRDRVHDLGVHRALGMTPGQTVAMVLASVAVVGVVGGVVGVPLGVVLHDAVLPAMGRGAGTDLPASSFAVLGPVDLVLLGLGGPVVAVLGALLPAVRAARTRTATALRTE
ncbi:FtsX-like permease family protein [Umezawaea sp.]|uniref:FtsX-like permease family protein n=1 Tax=Umezawaea sp. TaxID=1955258 RepID=UPI002ED5B275